jgi:lipid-binding SYLF domain-containing protein
MPSRIVAFMIGLAATSAALGAAPSTREIERVKEAAAVLSEIHKAPDKDIPRELWDKAACVIVVPSLKKAAFIVGGEYGKGLMSCRRRGAWSPPIFMGIGKGSWGAQIGAQTVDLVLLVMNERGMEKLLSNKVTLGVEASVAAGPLGRDVRAATDIQLTAEILSYSRTRGIFAGVNITGGVMKADPDDTEDIYGKGITPREIIIGDILTAPDEMLPFVDALKSAPRT